MQVVSSIVFDADERQTLYAVHPLRNLTPVDIGSWLRRAKQGDPLDAEDLTMLDKRLKLLRETLVEQADVDWWRKHQAPGADDAVEGLAAARAQQIDLVDDAMKLVFAALQTVGAVSPLGGQTRNFS